MNQTILSDHLTVEIMDECERKFDAFSDSFLDEAVYYCISFIIKNAPSLVGHPEFTADSVKKYITEHFAL